MMISRIGPIPAAAWSKARAAYGESVGQAYERAVKTIRDPRWLATCMTGMGMSADLAEEILSVHGGAAPGPWSGPWSGNGLGM